MNRDGLLIMSKGPKYEDELSDLQAPYRVEIMPVSLAVQRMTRNLIIVRKEAG
jgi:histidinol phosphatase-like enzyme